VVVIDVPELIVTQVAAMLPKETVALPVKFLPLMVTLVPPVAGPLVGLMLFTTGLNALVATAALMSGRSMNTATTARMAKQDSAPMSGILDFFLGILSKLLIYLFPPHRHIHYQSY
jgi:hypothetical protein